MTPFSVKQNLLNFKPVSLRPPHFKQAVSERKILMLAQMMPSAPREQAVVHSGSLQSTPPQPAACFHTGG